MKYFFDDNGNFKFKPIGKLHAPAWSNILTNGRLSCIVTDRFSGNVWYENAREFRVTPWINDPEADHGPESFHIDGMSVFAANDNIPCSVTYGPGFAKFEKLDVTVTVWINPNADTRIVRIEKNGKFTVDYDGSFTLGVDKSDAKLITILSENNIIKIASLNKNSPEFNIISDGVLELESQTGLTSRVKAKFHAIESLTILSGFGELKYCNLDSTISYWRQAIGMHLSSTPESRTIAWLTYQTLACRIMARCSIYQSGGALGFRDQLQDVCNLLELDSQRVREHIILAASHQYESGDVQHWWHPPYKGVRTRCSDDLLWLVWAVCEYCDTVGNTSILDEKAPYLISDPLADDERDRYETPSTTSYSETLRQHCDRVLKLVQERGADDKGFLKIGSCDWNDGFDKMGGGSSVWLTWFAASCFSRFGKLTDNGEYTTYAVALGITANYAFNGKYYERAYYADGSPLPIIDSIAQSWAVISGFGEPDKIKLALSCVLENLYDRKYKLVKLFTPPFRKSSKETSRIPGYVAAYLPGTRENGGQYTHAAIWLAIACLKTPGFETEGKRILNDLLPFNHANDIYRAEPFVLAADVYTHPEMYGRAGWTWYTGASGWMLRALRIAEAMTN